MSGSKHFDKIAWTVTALMLVVTILFMNGGALGIQIMAHTMGYENRLFDNTRVHTIDIVMNDWDEFIDNATSEQYYAASVVIDGEAYKNVGIRGKGNTSLSTVSSLGSERYSFKIEFDQYDSSMTYHGLDKLSLNNLIQDSTMMKDYLTYTMMNEFGATAPLCSFVYITVNGEDWGLYLAVEGVEDSFLERNYGSDYGELYKPDSMSFGGGRGNGKDFDMGSFMSSSSSSESTDSGTSMPNMESFDPSTMFGQGGDWSSMFGGSVPQGDSGSSMPQNGESFSVPEDFDPSTMFGGSSGSGGGFSFGGMGGFGMGSSDVKLQYIDDSIDSYSNIWNNAKTDITEADQNRLIESLKKLSEGEQIESVVDIEQVIRYFVVHNYVCNGDSYTGSMIHNYYLYEENGQMNMIPWDYNLAYGTFQGGNGQSTVNTPIDAPVSGGAGEDRPMWSWILSDESYTSMYHRYFEEFLNTVDIQTIIDNAYNLIRSYVEKDPTAFYTYEEFETGVETLRQFCSLRSESISMQLENGETTVNMSYVDASGLTLSAMGSMGGSMGGGMSMPGDRGDFEDKGSTYPNRAPSEETDPSEESNSQPDNAEEMPLSVNTDSDTNSAYSFLSGSMPPNMSGGYPSDIPEGYDPSQMPEGFDPSQMPEGFDPSQMPEGFDPSQMQGGYGTFPNMGTNGNMGTDTTPDGSDGSAGTDMTPEGSEGSGSSGSGSSTRPSRDDMQNSDWSFDFNMGGTGMSSSSNSGWTWIFVSALILAIGLLIAKLYKY